MRPSFAALVAYLTVSNLAVHAERTFYTDSSCTHGQPRWQENFDMSIKVKKETTRRLSSSTDTDYRRVVTKVFKMDYFDLYGLPYQAIKGSPSP
jgi:hypothetical protein